MYRNMKQWNEIRHRVLIQGVSKRQILRETGMHWTTLEKILTHSGPPDYRIGQPRHRPKLGPHIDWIGQILESDKSAPRKQRHTAKRIFDRLVNERGYQGGYTVVKDLVRQIKRTGQEVFMPLVHDPGEAQVDFFQALAHIDGHLCKVHVFVMSLVFSDMFFVMAFPRECSEAFWEGHVQAFKFFGGVPWRISYDNSRIAITKIAGCHQRELTDGFLRLQSHYLFESHFCTVRRPNEKGVVETLVRYARNNFMVPVPQVKHFSELNENLWQHCWNEQFRTLRGKSQSKQKLWLTESETFHSLPSAPFDISRKETVHANSLSLVRFDKNDYSVPVRYGHHELLVKGYIQHIEVYTLSGQAVAEHKRCWDQHQTIYNPYHYLPLLERKPGTLDHGLPLQGWVLPDCFEILRRRLESQAPEKHEGTKEYISVLCLLEKYSVARVAKAIEKALRYRNPEKDIIVQYCIGQEYPEVATFSLAGRDHLGYVKVNPPELNGYNSLMGLEVMA